MEWYAKTLWTVTGVVSFSLAIRSWNQYYRNKGQIHPITLFLDSLLADEEEDRQKRIESMRREADNAQLTDTEGNDSWRPFKDPYIHKKQDE